MKRLPGILILLVIPGWAPARVAGQESTATTASGRQDEANEAAPVATRTEYVLVEARIPYIPTSNTIATKLPVDLEWTPANVGVVGAPLLEEQRALVLGDALENISGVNVQTGQGVFDFFVVRGFDSLTSGQVLIDGAPEPEVTFYQMYSTERVELLKGPSGFLYGPNPLAGAVNIVRKQPVLSDFGTVSINAGSFATFEGKLDLNRASADGEASFRLNGLWRHSDGYRDRQEGEVGAVNPAFTWRPSEATTLNLNLEFLSSDYVPDAGLPVVARVPPIDGSLGSFPGVPGERSYASPFDRSDQDIRRGQVDLEHRFSERLQLRNKLYLRQLDWRSNGTLLGFVFPTPAASLAVSRSLLLLDDRQDLLGDQIEFLWTAQTGSVRHRLLAGVELARFDDRYTLDVAVLPPIDLFDPVETAREPLFLLPDQAAAGNSRSSVWAPYLIDEIAVGARLRFLVGARYDHIDFEDDVSGSSRTDSELSPFLGAVYRPRSGLSLYGNLARSFAPPSPRVAGERQPEESQEIELGARQELLSGRLRLTLALYELERENIAIPDDNGFTQQAGDQRARGLELELATELGSGWRGLLAYGYTDSELTRFTERVLVGFDPPTFQTVDRSGNRAAFAPEHLARVWLSKDLRNGMTLGGGLRYVGEQFIAEDNITQLDDHLLLDLAAAYDLGSWRFTLHLDNITDEEYDTRGFGSSSVIPGQPFSADLGIQYRF